VEESLPPGRFGNGRAGFGEIEGFDAGGSGDRDFLGFCNEIVESGITVLLHFLMCARVFVRRIQSLK
jgi:hypothetical protein